MATHSDEIRTHVVMIHGELTRHISNGSCAHVTLCGLDGDDSDAYQSPVKDKALHYGPITCRHCYAMWKACKSFKKRDFADDIDD